MSSSYPAPAPNLKNCRIGTKICVVVDIDHMIMIVVTKNKKQLKIRPDRVRRPRNYIIDHVNCSIKYWFWLILANFGQFWLILVYFGPFWPILVMLVDFGWFWPIFAYFTPFLAKFSLSWAIFANFCLFCQFRLILDILGWFWAILKKIPETDGRTDGQTYQALRPPPSGRGLKKTGGPKGPHALRRS